MAPKTAQRLSDDVMLQPIEVAQFLVDRIESIQSENALAGQFGPNPGAESLYLG